MKEGCILERIQIKNVRSLKDTGAVSLPKVTILVGENSSGKSTFLRTFPLIKQSICRRTDGPILWAGDSDDYVDFGSFSETVTNDGSETMEFCFEFPFADWDNEERYNYYSPMSEIPEHETRSAQIKYQLVISQRNNRECVSKIQMYYNETLLEFELDFDNDEILTKIDGSTIKIPEVAAEAKRQYFWTRDSFRCIFGFVFPDIYGLRLELAKEFGVKQKTEERKNYFYDAREMIIQQNLRFLGECFCQGLAINDISDFSAFDRKKKKTTSPYMEILSKLNGMAEKKRLQSIARIKLLFLYECLPQINLYLDAYFRGVHYVAPLRATAERYYRSRNLAIDEVDYQGKNLAVFLNGLTAQRFKSFQQWTQKYFGFKVLAEKTGGHVSVKIANQENGKRINLSDTGFGYSQILPIIIQLWDLSTRERKKSELFVPLVIAIEQPELHLHPAIQAKLVDAFIASIRLAREYGYELQLLLETHSQTIVNRFGQAIAEKKIEANDVTVLLFNRKMDSGQTEIQTSSYDQDGYLTNWPIGFFSP